MRYTSTSKNNFTSHPSIVTRRPKVWVCIGLSSRRQSLPECEPEPCARSIPKLLRNVVCRHTFSWHCLVDQKKVLRQDDTAHLDQWKPCIDKLRVQQQLLCDLMVSYRRRRDSRKSYLARSLQKEIESWLRALKETRFAS